MFELADARAVVARAAGAAARAEDRRGSVDVAGIKIDVDGVECSLRFVLTAVPSTTSVRPLRAPDDFVARRCLSLRLGLTCWIELCGTDLELMGDGGAVSDLEEGVAEREAETLCERAVKGLSDSMRECHEHRARVRALGEARALGVSVGPGPEAGSSSRL